MIKQAIRCRRCGDALVPATKDNGALEFPTRITYANETRTTKRCDRYPLPTVHRKLNPVHV